MAPILSELAEKQPVSTRGAGFSPIDELTWLDSVGKATLMNSQLLPQNVTTHTKVHRETTDDN